jgi:hypothetical protein
MGLTQSKLAVGDLIFDARLCGPEGGAVVRAAARLAGVLQLVAG